MYPLINVNSLDSDKFVNYLDILQREFQETICETDVKTLEEYFLEINVANLTYKYSSSVFYKLTACNKPIFIIPVNLRFPLPFDDDHDNDMDYTSGHSNVIIVDKEHRTIELFEPHGVQYSGSSIHYNTEMIIQTVFLEIFPEKRDYTYINVHSACPIFGAGVQQNDLFCLAWSLLIIELRLLNIDILMSEIINTLIQDHYRLSYLKGYVSYVYNKLSNVKNYKQMYKSYPDKTIENLTFTNIAPTQEVIERIIYLLKEYNNTSLYLDIFQAPELLKHRKRIFNELISYRNFQGFDELLLQYFDKKCKNQMITPQKVIYENI